MATNPTPAPIAGANITRDAGQQQAAALRAVLDRLDRASREDPHRRARRAQRAPFRRAGVPVQICHPGGSTNSGTVQTQDLSAGGIAFIYGGFLHHGTRIDVSLQRLDSTQVDVLSGRVVRCGLVGGMLHTVGVEFDRPISPEHYLDLHAAQQIAADASRPSPRGGRILYLDELDAQWRMFSHHLADLGITVTGCADLLAVRARLRASSFDVVVLDGPLPVAPRDRRRLEGAALAAAIRDAKHLGPIALSTIDQDEARVSALLAAAGLIGPPLRKPYDQAACLAAVEAWMAAGESAAPLPPLCSSLADQPSLRGVIESYIGHARALGRQLGEAARRRDRDECRHLCDLLRNSASGFGFQPLSDAAGETIAAIEKTGVQGAAPSIARLRALCAAVVGPQPVRPAAAA